jgi:hypothetical protein
MADIQEQFEKFHGDIRVDFDMAKELRGKRDAVLKRIRKYLVDNQLPAFRELGQGSYTMKTGTKPPPGSELEYDLDVALRFDFHEDDHTADEVRGWVYEALKDHTKRIEKKKPCIRVVYEKGYHIDVTSYAIWDASGKEQYRLARKDNGWTVEDPPALLKYVQDYRETNFKDTEDGATKTDQFRRAVRCLRRSIDVWRPEPTNGRPVGLALVLAAVQQGLVKAKSFDLKRSDDRKCLELFTRKLASAKGRLVAKKPTGNREDLFARLSDDDMKDLKSWMSKVADALEFAGSTADPVKACTRLQEVFGDEFPVPEATDTARPSKAPAIVTSSSSA